MSMRVNTNTAAINSMRSFYNNNRAIDSSFEKMSSGSRINKAADDAAGLAISENLKAQIRSAAQANRNANDGVSLVQTAEGGLNEMSNIIIRLRELGIQAASDTVGDTERGFINTEVQQLKEEMQRISDSTKWGQTKLLDGSTPDFDFQVGLNNTAEADRLTFDSSNNVATVDALGISSLDFADKSGATEGLSSLDSAQTEVNRIRSNLGALQNRLTSTINNLGVQYENLSSANSRIRDADVAEVSADLARNQILMQANTATLMNANQKNSLALKLLG
ncbi:MAG: flagellin FliC [Bdellovibrionaceae bacterium]|nr:flagellin FliC [Pseudobdellovibrionaceae bacterium]